MGMALHQIKGWTNSLMIVIVGKSALVGNNP